MTIEKHGNKWRIRERYKGTLYMVSVDHKPSTREAQRLIDEKINSNSQSPKTGMTMRSAGNAYISLKSNILSPSSIYGYRAIMKSLSEDFMSIKIDDITPLDVQKEVNDYSSTHSPKTTRNAHGFISAVLRTYKPSVQLNTTLPQKRKYDAITPTESEVKAVLDEVSGTEYEIAFRLGCYGMRRGEICAITAADLNGNLLKINKAKVMDDKSKFLIKPFPKTTSSEREIYIDDALRDMILEKGIAYEKDPHNLYKKLKRIQKKLNLPPFRFHDLRAYYVTMAHSLGIADKYIMANGGWASPNIMNRVYKRAFADKQAEINKQIAAHLS